VADLLAETAPAAARAIQTETATVAAERYRERRAGWFVVWGSVIRLVAYLLPWLVLVRVGQPESSVNVSGLDTFGGSLVTTYVPLIQLAGAISYLRGRREATPRLLFTLGLGSIPVFAIQYRAALGGLGPLRTALAERHIDATVSLGFGVWVELAGMLLAVAGGISAYVQWRRTRPILPPYTPVLENSPAGSPA
jgi:hypothetical protein